MLLEQQSDLRQFMKTKIRTAVTDKNPFHEMLSQYDNPAVPAAGVQTIGPADKLLSEFC